MAVDLTQGSAMIVDKARNLAKQYDTEPSIVHVIEPIVVGYTVEVTGMDVQGLHKEVTIQAISSLKELGSSVDIPEHRLHTVLGQPPREIRDLAKKIEADLVIMGRHGWELLFGSTSSSVTHGACCDLLIVHIEE